MDMSVVLSDALCAPGQHTAIEDEESARDNHVLVANFANYSPILIFFTLRLSNKPCCRRQSYTAIWFTTQST